MDSGTATPSSLRGQNRNPLHLVERNFFLAAVVKLRRSRRFVVGDLLRSFQLAAVLHVGSDASGTESVIADFRFDLRGLGPALNHPVGVLLPHPVIV